MNEGFHLRPGVDVPDEIKRDRLAKRVRRLRADAVLDKNTREYWNRMHPDEEQFDTITEDAIIAWCDGRGPLPSAKGEK